MFTFRPRLIKSLLFTVLHRVSTLIVAPDLSLSSSPGMFRRLILSFGTSRKAIFGLATVSVAGTAAYLVKQDKPDSISAKQLTRYAPVKTENLPVVTAELTFAPNVPKPITRKHPVRLKVKMTSEITSVPLTKLEKYDMWTYNKHCPGPFIRARVGDILDVEYTNRDESGMAHNIDFHAAMAPGGGASMLLTEKDQTKHAYFRLLYPGLFLYHCSAAPLPTHMANGMYGLILVEPEEGLPPVDKEFYVVQSEFYAAPSDSVQGALEFDYSKGLKEAATHVVFNAKEGALVDKPLMAKVGDTVRIFFGNAGPNLTSSFHVIGSILRKVYREGSLSDPPSRWIQTVGVPAGSACIMEVEGVTPGTFTFIDHAIVRTEKGAIGFLKFFGEPRVDISDSDERPENCIGCKMHE